MNSASDKLLSLRYKEQGNEAYLAKRFDDALALYSKAIVRLRLDHS